MEEKLKICPLCGAFCELVKTRKFSKGVWALCDNPDCNAQGPIKATCAEAIAAWNRRVND